MRKFITSFFLTASVITTGFSQKEKCLTSTVYQENIEKDSGFSLRRALIQKQIAEFQSKKTYDKTSAGIRIIPVVFHVIHNGGLENISKDQIEDQIKILNNDYRRLNKDTADTPGPFKNKAVDCGIEFRLAQKDDNGNCTEGVVRVLSTLTTRARDNVKTLSHWNSTKYLNIWVVKSIKSSTGVGEVLGYATLPGGDPLLDGIVLAHDVVGKIGTAMGGLGKYEAGRTATHEVGHWLDLYHTWGDDDECSGTDYVGDTPNQASSSNGCPTYPQYDACTGSGSGVMFMNYMDYSQGQCMNLFTSGQKARMDATLAGSRATIVSMSNLVATGTDGTPAVKCAPIAAFTVDNPLVCPSKDVSFSDISYNGIVEQWFWSFPGGTPATSTDQFPIVQYAKSGKYDVKLLVKNSSGSDSLLRTDVVNVTSPIANYKAPYLENFESSSFEGDWTVVNEDNGNTWELSKSYTTDRTGRLELHNYEGNLYGLKDILISPSFNLTTISKPILSFDVAYAQTSSNNKDVLQLYFLTCDKNWTSLATLNTSDLTSGIIETGFAPNPKQWRKKAISLVPSIVKENIRFKMEFVNGGGNNIYIDNFSISETVPSRTRNENLNLSFFPNPTDKDVYFGFNLFKETLVKVDVFDGMGRAHSTFMDANLPAGEHVYIIDTFDKAGMYFVRIYIGDESYVKKLVVY